MVLSIIIITLLYYTVLSKSEPTSHNIAVITEDTLLDTIKAVEEEHPRNKVEAVHEAIRGVKDEEFEDKAKEDYDEVEKQHDGKEEEKVEDSNQAGEDLHVVQEVPGLPPSDGSMVFKGPTNERQQAVVDAFMHAWTGYKKYAWGHDHLKPISKGAQNWFGLGLTLVDSLDTMLIMNLGQEFEEAKNWVQQKLTFSINKDVNLFETTIRVLGGLLSAFHLSGEPVFLEKAQDLGNRLMGSFTSASGIPYSDVNLKSSRGHAPKWSPDSSTSEVTTLQLEFRDLSRSCDEHKFEDAAASISQKVHSLDKTEGLVPIFINANSGRFRKHSTITLGARGDSYYEYLLKQWIQTGKTVDFLKEDFLHAMTGVVNRLVKRTMPNRLLFVGEIVSGGKDFKPKMDELVCFLPGTLALAAHHGLSLSGMLPPRSPDRHAASHNTQSNLLLELAEELAYTCYMTFARQPTHLAPEITHFNTDPGSVTDFYVKPNDAHYLLRPETIESLWYLYYVTGNKTYQEWGWKIFQGIEKYTKVLNGYTTVGNVRNALDLKPKDMMESFFLGETLKYLYLLFADEQEFDLDRWVFNTEAHPLPIHPS